jgi:hypothetical protein
LLGPPILAPPTRTCTCSMCTVSAPSPDAMLSWTLWLSPLGPFFFLIGTHQL